MSTSRRSSMTRSRSLNAQYLDCLTKYPLLTKSITAGVLAALNEQLASLFARDVKETQITENFRLKHTLTRRVPLMALFGFAINAPISHYGYGLLNSIFAAPLTPKKKVLQIITSLLTISPLLNALMVGYIALISMVPTVSVARIMHRFSKEGLDGLKDEYRRIAGAVGSAYQKSLFAVMKSSWITTPIAMAIAQNYLSPNIWVVFFNVVYFVLGTYNNTLVKISRKQQQIEEKAADKEPV